MPNAISWWLTRQLPPDLFTGDLPQARGYLHALKLLAPAIDYELIEKDCEQVKGKLKTMRHRSSKKEFKLHQYTGKRFSGGYSIEIDPSQFSSLDDCIAFAQMLIPNSWGRAGGIQVSRIDYAVEVDSELVPPHLFRWMMRVIGKRIDARYRSTKFMAKSGLLSGGELGKSPHKVMYYDVDARHHKKGQPYVKRTKLEIQVSQKSNMLPVEKLQDLKRNILAINPLERVEFINCIHPRHTKRLRDSKKEHIKDFQMHCVSECGHTASIFMNKKLNGNFKRDFTLKINGKERLVFKRLRIGKDRVLFKDFLYQTLHHDLQIWLGVKVAEKILSNDKGRLSTKKTKQPQSASLR